MKRFPPALHAFSLLELSMVLVLVGLIAGGIITGRALVRAAELRATLDEASRLNTAFTTFNVKYNALPGDMRNATQYWGAMSGGCAWTNFPQAPDGTKTCNGDGNGVIFLRILMYLTIPHESFMAWKHLNNAGLVEGNFLGWSAHTAGGDWAMLKDVNFSLPNVPEGPIAGTGFVLYTMPSEIDGWYGGYYTRPENAVPRTHMMMVGNIMISATPGPAFSAAETFAADQKMDDGKPLRGNFRVFIGNMSCHTLDGAYATPSAQVNYQTTDSANTCIWNMKVGE